MQLENMANLNNVFISRKRMKMILKYFQLSGK